MLLGALYLHNYIQFFGSKKDSEAAVGLPGLGLTDHRILVKLGLANYIHGQARPTAASASAFV